MKTHSINYPLLLLVAAVIGCLAFFGIKRLDIHTNIIESLPANEQVIVDALEIFANHPIHEQVAVDIMIDRDAPDILVECSAFLQAKMRASGLFAETGMGHVGALVPELAGQIVGRLPLRFFRGRNSRTPSPPVCRLMPSIAACRNWWKGWGAWRVSARPPSSAPIRSASRTWS
jgi:uncharacterized protein